MRETACYVVVLLIALAAGAQRPAVDQKQADCGLSVFEKMASFDQKDPCGTQDSPAPRLAEFQRLEELPSYRVKQASVRPARITTSLFYAAGAAVLLCLAIGLLTARERRENEAAWLTSLAVPKTEREHNALINAELATQEALQEYHRVRIAAARVDRRQGRRPPPLSQQQVEGHYIFWARAQRAQREANDDSRNLKLLTRHFADSLHYPLDDPFL